MRKKTFLTALATMAVAAAASAGPATAKIIEVGDTGQDMPTAACPQTDTCQAIGRVTGYQIQIGTNRNPFRVASKGRLVALTLKLPQPTEKQIKFFNDTFGGAASVRVAVLRPRPVKGKRYRYVLAGISERINLSSYFGSEPQFPLLRSLNVEKKDVIALTVETWLPAFAVGLGADNAWRASRDSGDCEDVQRSAVHERRGSIRNYGCLYRTARLLYKATVITEPGKTG
jgi:hypothetical protein